MSQVIRIHYGAAPLQARSYEATYLPAGWSWAAGTPMNTVEYVKRVEVYRPEAKSPCVAITTDGDKDNSLSFKGGRLVLKLRVPSPAFISKGGFSKEMGVFEVVAELADAIYEKQGLQFEPVWRRFTAAESPSGLENTTLGKARFEVSRRGLGHQDIFNKNLVAQLLFLKKSAPDPSTFLVDLRVRGAKAAGSASLKYLLAFAPQCTYSAELKVNGSKLESGIAQIEWVQPAEDVEPWPLAHTPVQESWLAWLHRLDNVGSLWNSLVADPFRTALEEVAGGEDASFMPRVESADSGGLSLCIGMDFKTPGRVEVGSMQLLRIESILASAASAVIEFKGLPLVDDRDERLIFDAELTAADDTAKDNEAFDRHFRRPVEFEQLGASASDVLRIRLRASAGKLRLPVGQRRRTRFDALDLYTEGGSRLALFAHAYVAGAGIGDAATTRILATETWVRELELADTVPGAEDPLPDAANTEVDSQNAPAPAELAIRQMLQPRLGLVIADPSAPKAPALLEVEEQTRPSKNRSMVLRLKRTGDTDFSRSVFYVGTEPFLVAKVMVPALDTLAGRADEIANWSLSEREGRKWELSAASRGFELVLPPQSVGEAMEKSVDQPDIQEGVPVDYRLSAPARMKLGSTWFTQGYAEAPWNLSRVLGYPGQRAPGARVDRLSFELVYGITTVVDASKVPQRLSLAEMFSRLGAPAPVLERAMLEGRGFQSVDVRRDVFLSWRANWAVTLRLLRSRLAVLELYPPGEKDTKGKAVPEPFSLTEGVSAHLRDGAYARTWKAGNPEKLDLELGADLRYPIDPARWPVGMAFYDKGLAGGFAWPFESHAVFQGLLRDRASNEATVSNLRFSALGAWGDQKASFDNKRTKIITTTIMGRLSRITVERVGRIGVFWNRSKHVIVYERTVLPTRQFKPSQLELSGRAVLRKVAEYVEILEPERRYPEFGALPQSSGFVEAIHFATRRILVESKWGRDGPDGLEIPLWNPKADPRIYARPSVFLHTSGDKKGQSEVAPRAVKEPDRLYFFSATAPDLDDRTDIWPPFAEVDYTNTTPPEPEICEAMDPDDGDALLPDAAADLPGWRRFTWPLEESRIATNIVASRAKDNALNALLTHVSMMRAAPARPVGAMADAMGSVDRSRAVLSQLRQNTAALRGAGLAADEVKARLLRELKVAQGALAQVQTGADGVRETLTKLEPGDWKDKSVQRLGEDLRAHVRQQSTVASKRVDDFSKQVQAELGSFGSALTDTQAKNLAQTWSATLAATLAPVRSGQENLLAALDDLLSDYARRREAAMETFDEMLLPVLADGGAVWEVIEPLDSAREDIRQALSDVASLLPLEAPALLQGAMGAVRDALGRVAGVVDAIFDAAVAQVEAAGPWIEPQAEALVDLRDRVFGDEEAPYVAGEVSLATPLKLLTAARHELADAISQFLKPASDIGAALIAKVQSLGAGAVKDLQDQVKGFCDAAAGTLRTEADAVIANAAAAAKAFTEGALAARGTLTQLADDWTKAQKQVQDWRNDLEKQASETVQQWLGRVGPDVQGLVADVEALAGRARQLQQVLGSSPTFQDPSSTLRLIRAVGEGPLLPEMTFNRERMAYFFDDYAAAVRSSPVAALVNRVGDDLKALGVRLPTQSFLERIIPAQLQNFDLGKVLPDFSALKNSALFERLKLPAIANDTVNVTQGFDQVNRVPWLKAKVDIPMEERSEAFKLGPLSLILPKANFFARSEMKFVGGKLEKLQEARVTADWLLEFGGAPLVTFEDTVLEFSEGGSMRFNIRPDRIRLDAALEWLTDLMKAYEPEGGSGLKIEMDYDGGRPVGVSCTLAAELPPLGAGVFAVSGVQLGAGLTLGADKESGEFAIGVSFNASRKVKPFTLTIAFLNGGGWIESKACYLTTSRRVVSQVSIGIVAGAGVEFALGPCAGSVYVQFGIFVEFSSGSAGGQKLSIGVMLLVRGSVLLFSIATVAITLLLQAVYRQDGSLTGYGSLSVSIRVSVFLKLSFSSQVTYNLAGGGGKSKTTVHVTASARTIKGSGAQALEAAKRQSQLFQ